MTDHTFNRFMFYMCAVFLVIDCIGVFGSLAAGHRGAAVLPGVFAVINLLAVQYFWAKVYR
jgi:hypothetical protein